jgi:hypothetical protein
MRISTIPAVRAQAIIGISVFILGIWVAWQLGGRIAAEDLRTLEYAGIVIAGIAVVVTTLRGWRRGLYVFFIWLLFEDLVRKFLGNNLAIYFGKDILVGIVYIAFFLEVRRGTIKLLKPRFLIFFYPCLFLCLMALFNPFSPSILYGLMGLKLNFYYMPLMFVGFALIRDDGDLRKFLLFNLALAIVIGGLGITQAILGNSFLNPAQMAPELRDLGEMDRVTPVSGLRLSVPSSVFVSAGRYSAYLLLMFVIAFGTVGYVLIQGNEKGRKLAFLALGLVVAALLFCGGRGALAYTGISILALTAGFLWGAPWRQRQAHKVVKATVRAFVIGIAAAILMVAIFPEEVAPRVAFYVESMDPSSSGYEVGNRSWDYPIKNLGFALNQPTWLTGIGLGTASLGTQYVAKLTHQPPIEVWVEEGYGQMILEMGVFGPILWILWTTALIYFCGQVTYRLRQTRFFPIALAITWYGFLLLFPLTYGGLAPYQNFVDNAYFWILVGILFKLPAIHQLSPNVAARSTDIPAIRLAWSRVTQLQ